MKRFRKFWLPALGGALLLACVALPVHADDPRSGLQYLPGPGSLPEGVVIGEEKVAIQEGHEQVYPALDSRREYWYLYGGDLKASFENGKYIRATVELGYYSSENAALHASKRFSTSGVPVEMRRRFPEVYHYNQYGTGDYYVNAVKGHYDVMVSIDFGEGGVENHTNDIEAQHRIAQAYSLFNWMMESVLKALPGESGRRVVAPSIREQLEERYAALREQHAELLESRTQVVAYRDKVVKIYHYNVLKLTIAFLMENLRPPTNVTDLVEEGIKSLLEQAGLTSTTQGSLSGVEIQRRLLKLVRSLERLAGQYLEQAKVLRAEMAGIQAQLKKLPK